MGFVGRMIASWFLIVAIVALVHDGIKSIANDGGFVLTALGKHWYDLHPTSLNATQAGIERKLSPTLWDPYFINVLQTPTWIVFLILAGLLYFVSRRRQRTNVFAN
ncbi:MAG: hypothetical protein AAFZ01_12495 [Pseudomonadota bacterium]